MIPLKSIRFIINILLNNFTYYKFIIECKIHLLIKIYYNILIENNRFCQNQINPFLTLVQSIKKPNTHFL